MKKWYPEEWRFKIEVLQVGRQNRAEECRLGLEPGDSFTCGFETPAGFCPTAFIKIFPSLEVVRCSGNLRCLGAPGPQEMTFMCPDGCVKFRLTAENLKAVE